MAESKNALPFARGFAPNTANLIRNFFMHPCAVPLQIAIETFVPAFLDAALIFFVPELDDILRATGQNAARGPTARGRGRRKHGRAIPLTAVAAEADKRSQHALRMVLTVTQPLENIGYALLLYHSVERFSYTWSSLLYDFEFCGRPPSEGPLQRETPPVGVTSTGTPEPLFLPTLLQNRASWPTSGFQTTLPFGHFIVVMKATFKSRAINPMTARIGFQAFGISGSDLRWSDTQTILPGQQADVVLEEQIFCGLITGCNLQYLRESSAVPIGVDILDASIAIWQFQPGDLIK